MTSETFQAQPWPRGVLAGSGLLALAIGCVFLTPAPWLIRLAALAIALLVIGCTLYVLSPPPRLVLDGRGFTLHPRLGRPRHTAWADVEAFEISMTPGLPIPLRILASLALLALAMVADGATSDDPTDTSRAAIGWRRRGGALSRRPDDWIVGHFGLPQEELLARLRDRLAASRLQSGGASA